VTQWKAYTPLAAVMLGLVALAPRAAVAGPPFRTDDPEPVEYQNYEFYTFTTGTHISGDTSGFGPAWEFNYGLIPNGQFHVIAPVAFDQPAGSSAVFGYGDTELGFKYRFIQEDEKGWRPMVGIFPLLELPTGVLNTACMARMSGIASCRSSPPSLRSTRRGSCALEAAARVAFRSSTTTLPRRDRR
jgi:hypothetical protein